MITAIVAPSRSMAAAVGSPPGLARHAILDLWDQARSSVSKHT